MRRAISVLSLLLLLLPAHLRASTDAVPSWFRADPEQPYAVFSAWKNLSTREAALYLNGGWTVLGGQLRDGAGRPLGLTPISINYHDASRGYSAQWMTDQDGYFLVYGPYSLDLGGVDDHAGLGDKSCSISAAPGYPATSLGYAYAAAKGEVRRARAQLLLREEERAFYTLTVDSRNSTFDERSLAVYRDGDFAKAVRADRKVFRDRVRPREGSTEGRKMTAYQLRVISSDGSPVPHALVKYLAYDGYEGNYQVVETDEEGRCEVEEYLLAGKGTQYYAEINRQMTVDAPGFGVGPIPFTLKEGVTNRIAMQAPAKVTGRVVDHRGDPTQMRLSVRYKRPNAVAFEADIPQEPDGSFSFERIIPGEEFRLVAGGWSRQSTPRASVESDEMVLTPNESRVVDLQIPLASAVEGVVVDQQGQPVGKGWQLALEAEDGERLSFWMENGVDGRFGFTGLGPLPFRIHVTVEGFEDYHSEEVRLEQGELRFFKITLTVKGKAALR